MDIIINPTNRCNFACEFCSAKTLPSGDLTSKQTIDILRQYKNNLNAVIVNGGDPLMMDPSYYFDILEFMEETNDHCFLSFTTNLLGFYLDPDKWTDLFKHKRVGIVTSFQYGDKRRYKLKEGKTKVFDEAFFVHIMKLFLNKIGYIPDFISVIDKDNEQYMEKTLLLAKRLNTVAKLNRATMSGLQKEYYPYYRMIQKVIEIIDKGYGKFEANCISLYYNYFYANREECDICIDCHNYITVINPDGSITTCSNLASGDFVDLRTNPMARWSKTRPINNQCLCCEHYRFCNGCHYMVNEVHKMKDEEEYCKQMKVLVPTLREKILHLGDE